MVVVTVGGDTLDAGHHEGELLVGEGVGAEVVQAGYGLLVQGGQAVGHERADYVHLALGAGEVEQDEAVYGDYAGAEDVQHLGVESHENQGGEEESNISNNPLKKEI